MSCIHHITNVENVIIIKGNSFAKCLELSIIMYEINHKLYQVSIIHQLEEDNYSNTWGIGARWSNISCLLLSIFFWKQENLYNISNSPTKAYLYLLLKWHVSKENEKKNIREKKSSMKKRFVKRTYVKEKNL